MRPPAGVLLLILAATPGGLLAQRVPLPTSVPRAGMVITRSARVAPGTYRLPAPESLPTIVPRAGMVITRSARVAPGTYRLPAPESLDSAVLTVRGDSLPLDVARP